MLVLWQEPLSINRYFSLSLTWLFDPHRQPAIEKVFMVVRKRKRNLAGFSNCETRCDRCPAAVDPASPSVAAARVQLLQVNLLLPVLPA